VTRVPVSLDLRAPEVLAPTKTVLRVQNANGGDLYLLPGMLLMFGGGRDFALIRLNDVTAQCRAVQFHETDAVPNDAMVTGETWAKANKDGTPDRRFANNFRIPIVRYGGLHFTSAGGLNEEFMFSDYEKTKAFAEAFARHKASIPN
jgi:hypothetical protein